MLFLIRIYFEATTSKALLIAAQSPVTAKVFLLKKVIEREMCIYKEIYFEMKKYITYSFEDTHYIYEDIHCSYEDIH